MKVTINIPDDKLKYFQKAIGESTPEEAIQKMADNLILLQINTDYRFKTDSFSTTDKIAELEKP